MNDQHWDQLVAVIRGEVVRPLPTGFIIDSPWLPKVGRPHDPRLLHRRSASSSRTTSRPSTPSRTRCSCRASGPNTACAPSRPPSARSRSGRRTSSRSPRRSSARSPTSMHSGDAQPAQERAAALRDQAAPAPPARDRAARAQDPLRRRPRPAEHRHVPDGHDRVPDGDQDRSGGDAPPARDSSPTTWSTGSPSSARRSRRSTGSCCSTTSSASSAGATSRRSACRISSGPTTPTSR